MNFSADVLAEAEDSAFARRDCAVEACGCLGSCEEGPNLSVDGQTLYDMSPDKVRSLVGDL
jgi:NADH:ubiquinone oxidoreductase subunit E